MDTGVGPDIGSGASGGAGSPAASRRSSPRSGVDPLAVELVLISHVHDDHIGWNVTEAGAPTFPNARYVIHRADWDLMANATDEEDREIFAAVLEPLERAGVVELSEAAFAVTEELRLEHAPGHTPGHQVLAIDSDGERALLSADLVNHPVQLLQPGLAGASDMDPVGGERDPERLARTDRSRGTHGRACALRRAVRDDRP